VPDAGVAIVLSGSATQREQVQRLGRVLRKREGKQAVLYEIITRDTIEEQVAERRKEHDAFR
jgi:superfamily II DNA or RNA helicase